MSTHNIRFYGEIKKIIPKLSPNTLLICSTGLIHIHNENNELPHSKTYKRTALYCEDSDPAHPQSDHRTHIKDSDQTA